MSLRDDNTRYTALKLLAAIVDDAMKAEKVKHLAGLLEAAKESGGKSWEVKHDGAKVATINLSQSGASFIITDQAALLEHIESVAPETVETKTVKSIKDWKVKEILSTIVDTTDSEGITKDGEVIPGIGVKPAGNPYQSVTFAKGGKVVLADAIRSGELRDLLADTGLPMLEQR